MHAVGRLRVQRNAGWAALHVEERGSVSRMHISPKNSPGRAPLISRRKGYCSSLCSIRPRDPAWALAGPATPPICTRKPPESGPRSSTADLFRRAPTFARSATPRQPVLPAWPASILLSPPLSSTGVWRRGRGGAERFGGARRVLSSEDSLPGPLPLSAHSADATSTSCGEGNGRSDGGSGEVRWPAIFQPTLAAGGANAILSPATWLARVVEWQTRQT